MNDKNNNALAYPQTLAMLTFLFFMWGFITCLNDILIPHLKAVFSLSYTQAMLIQFCFFGAYFLMSVPAGRFVAAKGYKAGIVAGLLIASLGCGLFYPAASYISYGFFLVALFVLATGITLLQVSANPYVNALGSLQTAASRLTMTQAFNSLGTTVAPFFGAFLILSVAANSGTNGASTAEADAVKVPYLLLATLLLFLAGCFAWLKLPEVAGQYPIAGSAAGEQALKMAWQHPHLVLGVICLFLYVGAEVAIGSFLISFLEQDNIADLSETAAARYIPYYWGGAMAGRFLGAVVMQKINPGKVLAFNAICACILLVCAIMGSGQVAMWAILLVGLCNSIMFPAIFSLALNGLGTCTSQGSGLLCLAIVGGAIVPLLQGVLADSLGIQLAFILPLCCYLYIVFYGLWGSRPRRQSTPGTIFGN